MKPGSMTAGRLAKVWSWTVVVPVLAALLLALTWGRGIGRATRLQGLFTS